MAAVAMFDRGIKIIKNQSENWNQSFEQEKVGPAETLFIFSFISSIYRPLACLNFEKYLNKMEVDDGEQVVRRKT